MMFVLKFIGVIIIAYIIRFIVLAIETIVYSFIFHKIQNFKTSFFIIMVVRYAILIYLAYKTLDVENIFIWAGLVWFLLMHTAFSSVIGASNTNLVNKLDEIKLKIIRAYS